MRNFTMEPRPSLAGSGSLPLDGAGDAGADAGDRGLGGAVIGEHAVLAERLAGARERMLLRDHQDTDIGQDLADMDQAAQTAEAALARSP